MKELDLKIKSNEKIADRTFKLVLECRKGEHGINAPGQFINIKIDGFFLRRPLSVCSWEEDEITVIYKTVGAGTETLSRCMTGEFLNILTPLGNGFDIQNIKRGTSYVTIGGGAGIPPMYGLCRELIEIGVRPKAVLGFNEEKELFYIDEFKKLGVDVYVATADGSVGTKGFVTDVLKEIECGYFYTCGPELMLRAIDGILEKKIEGQMSFEERMGCGFGACMGCSCKTKYGSKRICKDGPVLERGEIIW